MNTFLDVTIKFYNSIYSFLNLDKAQELSELWINEFIRNQNTLFAIITYMLVLNIVYFISWYRKSKTRYTISVAAARPEFIKKLLSNKVFRYILFGLRQLLFLNIILNIFVLTAFILFYLYKFLVVIPALKRGTGPSSSVVTFNDRLVSTLFLNRWDR